MKRLVIGLLTLLLIAGGGYVATAGLRGSATPPPTTASPVKTNGSIAAEGKVVPVREAQLALPTGGVVADVQVEEGQRVEAGAVLVRLDQAQAESAVGAAQAGLQRARANLAQLTAEPRSEDIDAARAGRDSAKAQLAKLQAGSRPEVIAQAQASLASAEADLKFLQSGGRSEAITIAQSNLTEARTHLAALENGRPEAITQSQANLKAAEGQLDALKAGPTSQQIAAQEQAIQQAKNAAYAADVNKDGACNPVNPQYLCDSAKAQAAAGDTAVNQAQAQLNILSSPPTEPQLRQAQAAVDAAKAQLEQARHPGSASDIAAAQAAVSAAQAQLNLAKQPASHADLVKAESAVEVATQQVQLAEHPYTQQDLDAAQAEVQRASAQLAQVEAPPRPEAVAAAQADVAAAQAQLDLANAALANLDLKAPFAGVITSLDVKPGEFVQPGVAFATIADTSAWQVETTDLTELNVARIHPGQAATVTFDAIPGLVLPARVERIKKLGTPDRGDILYTVTLQPARTDERLLWNMTAAVNIAP